jgi:DNA polymerase
MPASNPLQVVIDFETYYDNEYSLRKMTCEQYVRDPRFEVLLTAVKFPQLSDDVHICTGREQAQRVFDVLRACAQPVEIIAHNAAFEGMVMAEVFGFIPAAYADTLSMARPFNEADRPLSLAALSQYYLLGEKGEEVLDAKGKRLADFTPYSLRAYEGYCRNDVELTWKLYRVLRPCLSPQDMAVISGTVRASAVAQVVLDAGLLQAAAQRYAEDEKQQTQETAALLGVPAAGLPATVRSRQKFADLLRTLGAEPGLKASKTAKDAAGAPKQTLALGKDDEAFMALLAHDSPQVRAAAALKVSLGSSINRTRVASFLGIASRGKMPVPLIAFGAGSGRWAGTQKVNLQNLPKHGGDLVLRRAMGAPKGYAIVSCDLAQIEARRMAAQAGERVMLSVFAQGGSPYAQFGTALFGYEVSKHGGTDDEYALAKKAVLSLQYGMAGGTFFDRVRVGGLPYDRDFCDKAVQAYREKYPHNAAFLTSCQAAAQAVIYGGNFRFGVGGMYVARKGEIVLPDGWVLRYPNVRKARGKDGEPELNQFGQEQWLFTRRYGGESKALYRGIVANNVTQASATRIIMAQAYRLKERYGLDWIAQVHDEFSFLVPLSELEEQCFQIETCMRWRPAWAQETPIDCELTVGDNFADQMPLKDYLAR